MRKIAIFASLIGGAGTGFGAGYFLTSDTIFNSYKDDFIKKNIGIPPYEGCKYQYYTAGSELIPVLECKPENITKVFEDAATAVATRELNRDMQEYGYYMVVAFTVFGAMVGGSLASYYTQPNNDVQPVPEQKPQSQARAAVLQKRVEAADSEWKENVPEEFNDPLDEMVMDEPHITKANERVRRYDVGTLARLNPYRCPYSRAPLFDLGIDEDLEKRIRLFVEEKEALKAKKDAIEVVVEAKAEQQQTDPIVSKLSFFASSSREEAKVANNPDFQVPLLSPRSKL